MTNSIALLLIDCQNDFCHPEGSLYVPGAENDMARVVEFLHQNGDRIDQVFYTMDDHPVNDISHPAFWESPKGEPPAPLTPITLKEVEKQQWKPRFHKQEVSDYLQRLESEGLYTHMIWPYHCLTGSWGQSIYAPLFEALRKWALKGREPYPVRKGRYPLSEHFGVFQAQVPRKEVPETQLNRQLVEALDQHDRILVAGEAKSHCVANSLRQAIDLLPELAKKLVILEDAMSDVEGLGHLGEPAYQDARKKGMVFAQTSDFQF